MSTKENIIIAYDNFDEDSDVDILVNFVRSFGLSIVHEDENATHLVVKTYSKGYFFRSAKVGDWLVTNRPIVTFEWVTDGLKLKSLLPVVCNIYFLIIDIIYIQVHFNLLKHHYMPVDYTGEESPLASWRFGQGMIYSRNDWTNQCMLLFHISVKYNEMYPHIQVNYIIGVRNLMIKIYQIMYLHTVMYQQKYPIEITCISCFFFKRNNFFLNREAYKYKLIWQIQKKVQILN